MINQTNIKIAGAREFIQHPTTSVENAEARYLQVVEGPYPEPYKLRCAYALKRRLHNAARELIAKQAADDARALKAQSSKPHEKTHMQKKSEHVRVPQRPARAEKYQTRR